MKKVEWGEYPCVQEFTMCDYCKDLRWCEMIEGKETCEPCWMALREELVIT